MNKRETHLRQVTLFHLASATNRTRSRLAWTARILALALAAAVVVGVSAAQAATVTVCASGCAHTTISAAVAAASSGDTITVAAGTYTEQIVVDKNLTLTGAGSGTTAIQAPGVLSNDPDGAKTLVLFTGSINAEISGFTVQGPVDGLNFGIYVRDGATANIHDNTIKDIRDAPLNGAQNGYGIEIGKYNNTFPFVNQIGHATIANNSVYGYQKTGIECEGSGSSATITGNTVTGAGLIPTTSQNGIQIRRGATGSINNNTVTGNAYTGHEVNATGITVTYPGDNVIIQGNTVNHNTANIYTYQANGVQILNNQVSDAADGRVVAGITADSDDVATASVGITVTITGNSVKNNLSGGSHQGPGIFLWGVKSGTVSGNEIAGSGDDGILIGASGNITITNNLFSGNGFNSFLSTDPNAAAIDFGGIIPELESFGLQQNTLGGFTVHSNSFTGNRNALWNYDSGVVDAMNNWYGTTSGPGNLTNITTTLWCTDAACSTLSDNADLTSLSLSSGTLSPAFSPSVTSYTASEASGVTSVTVTTSTNPGANAVVSGGSTLSVGNNTVTVTVTSADGTTKTYTVVVNRAAAAPVLSGNADLASLSLSSGTLSPGFGAGTTGYSVSVDNGVAAVSVSAAAADAGASVSVSGGSNLSVGSNTVTVTVTAANGSTKTYTVTVVRAGAPVAGVAAVVVAAPEQSGVASVVLAPAASTAGVGTTPVPPVSIDVSWPANTFVVPVEVKVAPQEAPAPPAGGGPTPPPAAVAGGFSVGSSVVQLTVTDAATGAPITSFQQPITIHLSASQAGATPAYSHDGITWTPIPQLNSPELPPGQQDGYFLNSDGSLDIYTLHATLFGLLNDAQAPSRATLKAQVSGKKLYLLIRSKDNVGLASYLVAFNGRVVKRSPHAYLVLAISKAPTRVQVTAVDKAGNKSTPSATITIVRTANKKQPYKITR